MTGPAAAEQPPLVEIETPDIEAFRASGNAIPYTTTWDSGAAGPHVMLTALVHGNELCGAHAVNFVNQRGIRPRRGRLSVALCNVDAFRRFDRANPTASRYVDEDFNRVWDVTTLNGPRTSVELRRARELRPFIDTADLLLDLHSMQTTTLPLMLAGPLSKGAELARQVGVPALVVVDSGHAAGKRMRDYGGFGDPQAPQNALLVECGQHWQRSSIDVAIETTLRFLLATGTIDRDDAAPHLRPVPSPQRIVEVTQAVTVATPSFTFVEDYNGLEVIPKAGSVIARDGVLDVRTPYDDCVLIMPSKRLAPGQTAVRLGRFIG